MLYLFVILLLWWLISFLKPQWIYIPIPFYGVTVAPFIFSGVKHPPEPIKQHEYRHIWQQRWLSPPLFFILYIANFIINLTWSWTLARKAEHWRIRWTQGMPFLMRWWWAAYSFIIFEMDAARFWWPSVPD